MRQTTPTPTAWTLGVYLTLDRRRHLWRHATREQIAAVCREPVPACCADVRRVCERHGLSEEATAARKAAEEVHGYSARHGSKQASKAQGGESQAA